MAESELMSLAEIAELAGVKPRAVTEWVTKKQIVPRAYVKREGQRGGPLSMFSRAEVEVFLLERTAARTALVPLSAPGPLMKNPEPVNFHPPRRAHPQPESERVPLPIDRKLFLTLEEAAEYTGLAQTYIRKHAEGRRIGPHGSLVFRRQHLDQMY